MVGRIWEALSSPSAEQWQAVWTFATVVVAGVAAWIAIRQLRLHYSAQRELSRPYVVIDFGFRRQLLLIEIRNIGTTPAFEIEFDWKPRILAPDESRSEKLSRSLVDSTIPFLAPGRTIQHSVAVVSEYLSDEGMPRRYRVAAKYRDSRGAIFGVGESMILDIDQWAESLVPRDGLDEIRDAIDRQNHQVSSLSKELKATSERIEALHASARAAMKFYAAADPGAVGVRWLVEFPEKTKVQITNMGAAIAERVLIKDLSGDHSAFRLFVQGGQGDVAPGECITGFLLATLASLDRVQIRVNWMEDGCSKEEVLCLS